MMIQTNEKNEEDWTVRATFSSTKQKKVKSAVCISFKMECRKKNDHRTANLLNVLFEYTTLNKYRVDEEKMHEKNVFNICV